MVRHGPRLNKMFKCAASLVLYAIAFRAIACGEQPFYDRVYDSKVMAEPRHYRIFLPPDYQASHTRYPVIYYFHGHSDRYTLEAYDKGLDTIPKIAAFARNHDAIVVAPDGYVARDYTGFYGGSPYDVRRDGGDFDFGVYFVELVQFIDSHYRTLTPRRFRSTSGLSMGGYMSLFLSARYPELIGSASAFNPGPEFYAGEKGRRSLWRPKDHVLNHEHTAVRLVQASGDYISQYHEETRAAYASQPSVDFEFRQDEYHRHWATSIAETFDFHMRAFTNPALDSRPRVWNYDSAYRSFEAHGYRIQMDTDAPALVYLRHVEQKALGIRTRRWAPDGPAAQCGSLNILTAPLYRPNAMYRITDYDLDRATSSTHQVVADHAGRLNLATDCAAHEFGINGPGADLQAPRLLPLTASDYLRVQPGKELSLPVRVFNPRSTPLQSVTLEVSSKYPTVEVLQGKAHAASLNAGGVADLSSQLRFRFTAGAGDFARARLQFKISADTQEAVETAVDIMIAPDEIPAPMDIAILDGKTRTFSVFRQRGNQGGGSSINRTVSEGHGNGNGILEPGEQATIWVRVRQGLDPFDKGNWRRAKIYGGSRWLKEVEDIEEQKQLEWTSAQNRTSLIALSPETPAGTAIPLILDTEGWSFYYMPDVRYGRENLYQAFQRHKHQLFAWTWKQP